MCVMTDTGSASTKGGVMKVALYCEDRQSRVRSMVAQALSVGYQVVEASTIGKLISTRKCVRVVVVVPRWEVRERWPEARQVAQRCPMVVVTCAENGKKAASLAWERNARRTVELSKVDFDLLRIVTEMVIDDLLWNTSRRIATAAEIGAHPKLRKGILLSLAWDEKAIATVNGMGRAVDCSRRSLERSWRSLRQRNPGMLTLKQWLSAVVLLRSLRTWVTRDGETWKGIAEQIGISPQTIRAYLRKWIDLPPARLTIGDAIATIGRVERDLLIWTEESASDLGIPKNRGME